MKTLLLIVIAAVVVGSTPQVATSGELASGEYFITQSWSQEKEFKRPYFVSVPPDAEQRKLPAFVFLHGNGGNAKGAMNGFRRGHPVLAARYIMVFPDGYLKSWNIVSERSKADDRGFIEAIVERVATYDNVQSDNFTIMGSSNGAALVNQLAIECRLSNIRNYISGVSPLNVFQHDGKNFKAKGDDNNYRAVLTPLAGKRLMNISGTDDRLVPYRGGLSRGIPAKGESSGLSMRKSRFFYGPRQWDTKARNCLAPAELPESWRFSVISTARSFTTRSQARGTARRVQSVKRLCSSSWETKSETFNGPDSPAVTPLPYILAKPDHGIFPLASSEQHGRQHKPA